MQVVARRALAVTAAALLLGSCTESGAKPDGPHPGAGAGASTRAAAMEAYKPPDSPFTRENTVLTATCEMGARYAAVTVRAWRPGSWKLLSERWFPIPGNAVFSDSPGAAEVHSPLVELCATSTDNKSPYAVDDAEFVAPRVRSLFDQGFTRMAVVLRKPGSRSTQAGTVSSDDSQDDIEGRTFAGDLDEQNAAMSPDGRSVWFTYTDASGRKRIGSRAVDGDHHVSDAGPANGHDLPLSVMGQPPVAVQAETVRLSPDRRLLTATAPSLFGTVFDRLDSSSALNAKSAHHAVLLSDCVGAVGWVSNTLVLCRSSSGAFQPKDARSGKSVGDPIRVVGADDGTVAEGMLVSADGDEFIVSVHVPNDPHGPDGITADFRTVPTAPGRKAVEVPQNSLSPETVFLDWL